jgi:hypothetical protein
MDNYLEQFRLHWPSIKVTVYNDMLVYKVGVGYADSEAGYANKMILDLGLPLIAEATTLHTKNSFSVKIIGDGDE